MCMKCLSTSVNFWYPASPTDAENPEAPCAAGGPNATILGGDAETIYINYLNVSLPGPNWYNNVLCTWDTVTMVVSGAVVFISSTNPSLDAVHWHCGYLHNGGPHVLLWHQLWPLLQVPTGSEDCGGHYHNSRLAVSVALLHLGGAGNLPHCLGQQWCQLLIHLPKHPHLSHFSLSLPVVWCCLLDHCLLVENQQRAFVQVFFKEKSHLNGFHEALELCQWSCIFFIFMQFGTCTCIVGRHRCIRAVCNLS